MLSNKVYKWLYINDTGPISVSLIEMIMKNVFSWNAKNSSFRRLNYFITVACRPLNIGTIDEHNKRHEKCFITKGLWKSGNKPEPESFGLTCLKKPPFLNFTEIWITSKWLPKMIDYKMITKTVSEMVEMFLNPFE